MIGLSSWQPPRPSTATQDDVRAQAESRRKRQEWLDWERIQEQHIRQCRNQVNSLKAAIALLDTSIELNRAKLKNDVPYWWNVFRSPMLSEKEKSEIRRGILDNGAAMRIKQASLKREQSDLEKLDIELVQRKNQELIRLEVERVEKEKRARAAREKAGAEARQRAAAEHARQRAAQEAKAKAAREEAAKEEAARRERMAEVEEALKRHRETMEKEREKRVEEARKARQTQRQNYSYGGRNGSQHQGHNQTPEISCEHSGWWSKLEGRRDCPHCTGPCYTFALQCPGCATIACVACRPKLQAGRKPPLYDHSQQRQGAANRHTKGNGRGHRAPQQGRNDEHNQYNIYDWF
ncbi:hypothetical protein BKA66DRAFT_614956 [Pyrenochaeta sp. MPI-SDFR-AT-0127]|nr:hypothetical protein BKA66DRAFT_614956 [Pyrenochaeta sp. MPI-SDFR-AT-0127]